MLNRIKKLAVFLAVFALCIANLPVPAFAASNSTNLKDYTSINSTFQTVWKNESDWTKAAYQRQVTRYEGSVRKYGQCNVCSITNLLNRRLAKDGIYSASDRFQFEYVFYETCLYTSGTKKTATDAINNSIAHPYNDGDATIDAAFDSDGYFNNPIYTLSSTGKKYQLKLSYDVDVDSLIKLINNHPEGIFIRYYHDTSSGYRTSGHCIVLTKYENGKFYAVDTASASYSYDCSFDKTWSATQKCDGSAVTLTNKSQLQVAAYLEEVSSGSPKMNQKDFFKRDLGASTLGISMTAAPSSLDKGSSFNLAGTVSSNYKITSVVGSILSGSTTKQSVSLTPNTTSVNIGSSSINSNLKFGTLAAGTYTFKIVAKDSSGASKTYTKSFTVKAPATSTLAISMTAAPSSLDKGSSFNLAGTVSSNYKITSVVGSILSGSTTKQSVSLTPNATSVNIGSSSINSNLKFGTLAAGTYTFKIVAKDSSGASKTYTKSFTVKAPATSTLAISMTAAPSSLDKGSSFNLAGTVSSNYKITSVVGSILSGSTTKQSVSLTPNTTSVNIGSSSINSNLKFGTLAAGTYTLKIVAKDSSGATKTYTKSFTVKAPAASTLSIGMTAAPSSLKKGSSFNLAGTVSSNYKITSVVGSILSGSTTKQSVSLTPNTTSVNIGSSSINSNLKFGTLAAGTYTLKIVAKDSSGATKTYTKTFTVK